jgi:hypothetical protein
MVGINNNRATDLARHLKTQHVEARHIRAGDIIWDDHNVWCVVKVSYSEEGIRLHEVDGNDTFIPKHLSAWSRLILDRSIVKEDQVNE